MKTSHATRIYCNGCKHYFATLPDYNLHDCIVFSAELKSDENPPFPTYRELLRRAARKDPIYRRYASYARDDPLGLNATIDALRHKQKAIA